MSDRILDHQGWSLGCWRAFSGVQSPNVLVVVYRRWSFCLVLYNVWLCDMATKWVLFYVFQELEWCYPLYSWHGQTDTHVNLMFQPRAAAAVCCDWSYLSTPIVRSGPVAIPVALLTTWALSWFLLSPRLKSIFLGWLCLLCFSLTQSSPTLCLYFLPAFHHLA